MQTLCMSLTLQVARSSHTVPPRTRNNHTACLPHAPHDNPSAPFCACAAPNLTTMASTLPHTSHTFVLRPSLSELGPEFFTPVQPASLPAPRWVGTSLALARELGLDEEWLRSDEALHTFTGNHLAPGSAPVASVYSGHQFGNWAGQLGDGRALLLGELNTPSGVREVQLKGAGLTPYSRMGDGRAVLRSSIREFLCSEAMHALGIPTTRALCVTGSPQPVRRETVETAAVVTRTAPSFIRFGHFEHFSYSGQHDELKRLADHMLDRFYPECREPQAGQPASPYAALLQAVSERTAHLVAQWQAVGFCHGVMNTDNMSMLGLTLDYGPFQFMDGFNPDHICNHTDTGGRYAYNRQPQVAYWNLFCLGQALLPLMADTDEALAALESYKTVFPAALTARMSTKLGLQADHPHAKTLIDATLNLLAKDRTDYTLFWHRLGLWLQAQGTPAATERLENLRDLLRDRSSFDTWMNQYQELKNQYYQAIDPFYSNNLSPKFVLRNHLGQMAIERAQAGDMSMVAELLAVLQAPYGEHAQHSAWAGLPPDWAAHIEISCSS